MWRWHDSVETCSSLIIYKLIVIVLLLVVLQNSKKEMYSTCIEMTPCHIRLYGDVVPFYWCNWWNPRTALGRDMGVDFPCKSSIASRISQWCAFIFLPDLTVCPSRCVFQPSYEECICFVSLWKYAFGLDRN